MNTKALRYYLTQVKTWLVILLALGVFFRFYHLDYKVYWYDETQTSLRISGHTRQQMTEAVYDGQVRSVRDLLAKYQYPNDDRDLEDTLNALAGSPEHAPLYFLTARFWLQLFGHSVTVIRSLSALFGLLVLPCMYWLCWELFKSPVISWAAVVLVAISPFHMLYAQEARQYSLWTVSILLSSAALLRAIRLRTLSGWALYAVSAALAFYTHTFSVLVMLGHGIYVALSRGVRSKPMGGYLLALVMSVLLFFPWLQVIIGNFSLFTENTASVNVDRADLHLIWGLNLSRLFFDLNQGPSWINPVTYLLLALVIYGIYFLCRHAPSRAWLFILTLMGVTGLALIGPDVILGGRRSSITRYAIPSFLGIEIVVAYLLTMKLLPSLPAGRDATGEKEGAPRTEGLAIAAKFAPVLDQLRQRLARFSFSRKAWRNVAIALVFSGVLSCAVNSQLQVWWHKSHSKSRFNPQAAAIVNQSDRPLVISDENPGMILSFCHLLKPQVRLQLMQKPNVPQVAAGFSDVYLYRPTDNLRQSLAQTQNFTIEPAYKGWLWKLRRN